MSTALSTPAKSGKPARNGKPVRPPLSESVTLTPLPPESSIAPGLARDLRIESLIEDHFLSFRLIEVDLSTIDVRQSLQNQSRLEAINDDVVIGYGVAMEGGDIFPPLVLHQISANKFVVIDGNHRIKAANLARRTTFPAYIVINPTPAQVELLTYAFNTLNGLPTSTLDRQHSALLLTDAGMTTVRAAQELRIPVEAVRRAVARRAAENRFLTLGVRGMDNIPLGARERLASIDNDNVLRAAARAVIVAQPKNDDVAALVKGVGQARTEAGQIEAVQNWAKGLGVRKRITVGNAFPVPKQVTSFQRGMSTVQGIDLDELENGFKRIPTDVATQILTQAADAQAALRAIVKRLAPPRS